MPPPSVSIGMPVYNGERTVAAAIDSILRQTWTDWELVISDNASTDATESICRGYADKDSRIRYIRQPANLGAPANFRRVLDESTGKFFMWAAADDRRSDDFIEANASFLESHPEYVASCSPVRLDAPDFDPRYVGDTPVTGTRAQRILGVIPSHANGRFYSLFRRQALAGCDLIERQGFLAGDWAIMIYLAALGPLNRVEHGWTLLGVEGASRSNTHYRNSRRSWVEFWLPFLILSRYAWAQRKGFTAGEKLLLLGKLAHLNAFGFVAHMKETGRRWRAQQA